MKNAKAYLENENKWIATDRAYKKVFVADESLNRLQKDVKRKNIKDAIIMYVPSFNQALAPKCQY